MTSAYRQGKRDGAHGNERRVYTCLVEQVAYDSGYQWKAEERMKEELWPVPVPTLHLEITEAQAREIYETMYAAWSEGQGGGIGFLEKAIAEAFPSIKAEHPYYPWPT